MNAQSKFYFNIVAVLFACAALLPICSWAQVQPALSYTQDFPGSDPQHYSITIHPDGTGKYESDGRLAPEASGGDMTALNFNLPTESCKRMFALAKKAHYFSGKINSDNRKIASTGKKVLSYTDAQRSTKAEYDFSPVAAVQELTSKFQNLSSVLEFGRRLAYEHRYEKLALAEEMRGLMQQAQTPPGLEIEAIAPALQSIVDDHSVLTYVRARAQLLLQNAKTASLKK